MRTKIILLSLALLLSFSPQGASAASTTNYDNIAWGLKALGVTDAWGFTKGKGVRVAVLDTGVDGTHPDLKGRVLEGYSTISGEILKAGIDSDVDMHGTHVAGIIAGSNDKQGITGVAPEALIIPVQVLSSNGGSDKTVSDGIIYAISQDVDVINLSLGGSVNPFDKGGSLTCTSLSKAVALGIVVVVSSGNSATYGNPRNEPASCKGALSVGALNESLEPAYFSSFDSTIGIAAPGRRIVSSIPVGTAAENFAVWDGTSMAAPFVSGAAALLIAAGKGKGEKVVSLLKDNAVDVGVEGFDPLTGAGLVNLSKIFGNELSLPKIKDNISKSVFSSLVSATWNGSKVNVSWGVLPVGRVDSWGLSYLRKGVWSKAITFKANVLSGSFESKILPEALRISANFKDRASVTSLSFYDIANTKPPTSSKKSNTKILSVSAAWELEGIRVKWKSSGDKSDIKLMLNDYSSSLFEYVTISSADSEFFYPVDPSSSARSSQVRIIISSEISSLNYSITPQYFISAKVLKAGEKYLSVVGSTVELCYGKKLGCQGALVELVEVGTGKVIAETRVFESLKFGIDFIKQSDVFAYILIDGFASAVVKVG